MKTIGVFGIGSPYGDDSLGFVACDRLSKHDCTHRSQVTIKKLDSPLLLLQQNGFDRIYVIDAICSTHALGTLHFLTLNEWPEQIAAVSTHAMQLKEIMNLGKMLKRLPEDLTVVGITIGEVNRLQNTLSAEIDAACDRLVDTLVNKISEGGRKS